MNVKLSAPQPLLAEHDLSSFTCGRPELDEWLKGRAMSNHNSGASRVLVTTDSAGRVYGYYALAAGAVAHVDATGNDRRNVPDPIPMVVFGRLARDANADHVGALNVLAAGHAAIACGAFQPSVRAGVCGGGTARSGCPAKQEPAEGVHSPVGIVVL